MQHMLSVTGNLCADKLPFVSGVQVSGARDNLVFQADSAENMQRLKRSLALSLANTIIEEYEGRYLEAYINKAYQNLDTMERQKVFCAAAEEMERTSPKQRAHYIENRLYAFLDTSDVLSIDGFDLVTNLSAELACFNSIGPGIGSVGPMSNYSAYSGFSKILLSLNMLLGRLEIFPILVLFTPQMWKKRV